jgi:hypothetical protein
MVDSSGNTEVTCSALSNDGENFTCTWIRST